MNRGIVRGVNSADRRFRQRIDSMDKSTVTRDTVTSLSSAQSPYRLLFLSPLDFSAFSAIATSQRLPVIRPIPRSRILFARFCACSHFRRRGGRALPDGSTLILRRASPRRRDAGISSRAFVSSDEAIGKSDFVDDRLT